MKIFKVIERATGKVDAEWNGDNVKSYCKPEDIEKMRNEENHHLFHFMIEFRGLEYDLAMYEADKYDLVIETFRPKFAKKKALA